MQTSRFQLGLIATLAVGLGFSLSSSDAVGYPAGAAVSFGANPVFSVGGSVAGSGNASIVTAPADQDLVVTDVHLQSYTTDRCRRAHRSILQIVGGSAVAHFETSSAYGETGYYEPANSIGSLVNQSFGSGVLVPAGSTLQIETAQTWQYSRSSCGPETTGGVRYTLSGYYAQP